MLRLPGIALRLVVIRVNIHGMERHRNRASGHRALGLQWSLCAAMLLACSCAASAAVIYSETFPNTSSPMAAQNFSTVGWSAHVGSTATDYTDTTNVSSSSPAVIWTTNGQGGGPSYGFASSITNGALYWTTEIGAVDPETLESVTFYSNHGNNTALMRVAIRIAGQWFASNSGFTHSVGGGSSGNWSTNGELETFAFSSEAAEWRDLTFVPGTTLLVSATARTQDLPAGNIDAIGLYAQGSSVRFDTVTVTTPEPGSIALLIAGVLPLLARRRRV